MTGGRLGPVQRAFVRDLARAAVAAAAQGGPAPDPRRAAASAGVSLDGALLAPCGVFVTLRRGRDLRGCIGTIVGSAPLVDAVVESATGAAVRDPRFPPVRPAEVPGLDLEVSVLTPLQAVADADEIEPGRHGVLLEAHGHSAVFLPQVAAEQGWDRVTLLDQLALKAGLPPDVWRRGASLRVFEAEVF